MVTSGWALAVLATCIAAVSCTCTVTPWVDEHYAHQALDVSVRPTVGWGASHDCGTHQTAYSIRLFDHSGQLKWHSGTVDSSVHRSHIWPGPTLDHGQEYMLSVKVAFGGLWTSWSEPRLFLTSLSAGVLEQHTPLWHQNASAQFVLARSTISPGSGNTYLRITAKPAPNWHKYHFVNTSHLLCAYKLWVSKSPEGRPEIHCPNA